jgi:hypothetical protein
MCSVRIAETYLKHEEIEMLPGRLPGPKHTFYDLWMRLVSLKMGLPLANYDTRTSHHAQE